MTAKHRKGKSNHKHEDNFFKNEVVESEVRAGANNYALLLVLFLLLVIGGATGAWFCFQQHQTLTHLSDNLMGMQMKIVKLQSSHEEMRQSSSKQHASEGLETRLIALEESYALAQKQVGMALATAEQLRTSDLPSQVLSLHTEMKTRLSEMQRATVSLEQLSQLQTVLKGKSEEFEGVRVQVDGLASLSTELSQKVGVLDGSLGEMESKLDEGAGHVATLGVTLDGQAAEVLRLKEQLDSYQAQLEASTQEVATVRGLFESEQSQRLQQASVEEQLSTVRQSLQDQTSAARSLTSGLEAQLADIQKQVTQLMGETPPSPAEPEELREEEAAPAADEEAEEETAPGADEEVEEETAPGADEEAEEETAPAAEEEAEEEAAPAAEEEAEEETAPGADEEVEEETAPAAEEETGEETAPAADEEKEEETAPVATEEQEEAEEDLAAATEEDEKEALPAEKEASESEDGEGEEAAAQEEAPVEEEEEEEDSVADETAPAEEEETEKDLDAGSEEEEVKTAERVPEEASEEVQEEGEETLDEEEERDEEQEEEDEGEEPLGNDVLTEDELHGLNSTADTSTRTSSPTVSNMTNGH